MHFREIRQEEVSRIHPVQDKNHMCPIDNKRPNLRTPQSMGNLLIT